MLDESPALQHRNLGGFRANLHQHHVAAHRASLATTAPTALQRLLVELYRPVGNLVLYRLDWAVTAAAASPSPAAPSLAARAP